MTARCRVVTGTILGIEAHPVDVEVELGPGLPAFAIVGLPDTAVQEARERVRSALRACGYTLPDKRIVVNLAPGPLRKHGTGFDLPIALGILGATGQVSAGFLEKVYAVGELSLDGGLRAVSGMLAHALCAHGSGRTLLGPLASVDTSLISGLRSHSIDSLSRLDDPIECVRRDPSRRFTERSPLDFDQVVGQALAIRALTIAAAGRHNVLMTGPPGTGKTMLARRLPTIMPALDPRELLETSLIHSVAGYAAPVEAAGFSRPFRAPHHTSTTAGMIGGGSPPLPGEVSLAHNGVLFLDELPEFAPSTLQSLRQPLEDGFVSLVRADGRITFPARFTLIAAANPCPCGYLGSNDRACSCPPAIVERYHRRIGGPLMDRIDIICTVNRPDPRAMLSGSGTHTSADLRRLVNTARDILRGPTAGDTRNASGKELVAACRLDTDATGFIERAARTHRLSGRALTRVLRVARTIAAMEGRTRILVHDLSEALAYRGMDLT